MKLDTFLDIVESIPILLGASPFGRFLAGYCKRPSIASTSAAAAAPPGSGHSGRLFPMPVPFPGAHVMPPPSSCPRQRALMRRRRACLLGVNALCG